MGASKKTKAFENVWVTADKTWVKTDSQSWWKIFTGIEITENGYSVYYSIDNDFTVWLLMAYDKWKAREWNAAQPVLEKRHIEDSRAVSIFGTHVFVIPRKRTEERESTFSLSVTVPCDCISLPLLYINFFIQITNRGVYFLLLSQLCQQRSSIIDFIIVRRRSQFTDVKYMILDTYKAACAGNYDCDWRMWLVRTRHKWGGGNSRENSDWNVRSRRLGKIFVRYKGLLIVLALTPTQMYINVQTLGYEWNDVTASRHSTIVSHCLSCAFIHISVYT